MFKLLGHTLSIILLTSSIVNAFSVSQCTFARPTIDKRADIIASSLGASIIAAVSCKGQDDIDLEEP
ncbi:MAG TPA: hypothetical protein VE130_08895 [Nitrososphaeraceae archaeon]|nr:hypothetical protein [Nitrososphaeraceae archaeon]